MEEPVAAAEFKDAKRRYETAIDSPGKGKGSALLLAVYRGKMSEVCWKLVSLGWFMRSYFSVGKPILSCGSAAGGRAGFFLCRSSVVVIGNSNRSCFCGCF